MLVYATGGSSLCEDLSQARRLFVNLRDISAVKSRFNGQLPRKNKQNIRWAALGEKDHNAASQDERNADVS